MEALKKGEDPNRYDPMGMHSHPTPLHQTVWSGSLETVKVLIRRGARLDLRDVLWDRTALESAEYRGRDEVAERLRSRGRSAS